MGLMRNLVRGLVTPTEDADQIAPPDHTVVKLAGHGLALLERYFRARVIGLENMPPGPVLLVGNHNAGITFLEPFFLGSAWYRHTQGADPIYFLGHDVMVSLPLVGTLLKRLGVIRASQDTARAAFASGHKVMAFPGGNREAFRPFSQRHRVDFGGKTGFVKLALRARVNIVPVLSMGGHETFFVLTRGERLAKLTGINKYLRSEAFPVFLGLPWGIGVGPIFHLPLPSKLVVEVGQPLDLAQYEAAQAEDPHVVGAIAQQVQDQLQDMMDRQVGERRWPVLG